MHQEAQEILQRVFKYPGALPDVPGRKVRCKNKVRASSLSVIKGLVMGTLDNVGISAHTVAQMIDEPTVLVRKALKELREEGAVRMYMNADNKYLYTVRLSHV